MLLILFWLKIMSRLNPDQYVKVAWRKVEIYINGVRDGSIITNKWIKIIVENYVKEIKSEKYDYNIKSVDRVFKFFSLLNIDNDNGYEQFDLHPFQAFYLANIFGFFIKDTKLRKYSKSFLFIGRKNGKTSFSSALQLYFLVADGAFAPQSILIASRREQAKLALIDLQRIILNTSELAKRLKFSNSRVYLIKKTGDVGFCETVPSRAVKLDGYKLNSAILDEIHSYPDNELYNVCLKGTASRNNSLLMMISTAGFNLDGFCMERLVYSKKLLLGEIEDESFFPMLYCLDDDDKDISNRNLWMKSNPGLGSIKKWHKIEEFYKESINSPINKYDFLTKDLNVFVGQAEQSILDEYLLGAFKPVNEEKWLGKPCWIGVDLSATDDLSSIVALFYDKENDYWESIPYFFMVNDIKKMQRKAGLDLRPWIEKEYITVCSGKTIDYDLILAKINELKGKFKVKGIGYDPYNFKFILPKIKGIDCVMISQTALVLSEPLKYIIKSLTDGNISISDNPAALWCWRNSRIKIMDGSGNIRIVKNESKDSTDGAVALNNAMALYFKQVLDPMAPAK